MSFDFLKLIFGLYIAIKGADVLISNSTAIGRKLKISDFFIGLVIVGFGTSISELLVSIEAVLSNSPDLSIGNILGSNIANILLVLSVVGFINSIKINKISRFDIIFHLVIHLAFFLIFTFYKFDFLFGILFLTSFIFYMIYSFKNSMVSSEINSEVNFDSLSKFSYKKPVIFGLPIVVISIIITLFGVNISVESAIKISDNLNIPDSFIGLSVIAIGTSLPELVTSIAAAKRKKSAIIFGNIIGSNIYNLLFILGISSLFELFNYQKKILELDVIFLSLIVTLFSFTLLKRYDINLKFSLICLFGYLFYISNLVMRNFWKSFTRYPLN